MKFVTNRLRICSHCVKALNATKLSARAAIDAKAKILRSSLERKALAESASADAVIATRAQAWLPRIGSYVESILPNWLNRICADKSDRSIEIRVIRAYRLRLVCMNRSYLKYPRDWAVKSLRVKHYDGFRCCLCSASPSTHPGLVLHAHHMIFRSNSGTNQRRNLITLCFDCHQAQHEHPLSAAGGEADGVDDEVEVGPTPHLSEMLSPVVDAPTPSAPEAYVVRRRAAEVFETPGLPLSALPRTRVPEAPPVPKATVSATAVRQQGAATAKHCTKRAPAAPIEPRESTRNAMQPDSTRTALVLIGLLAVAAGVVLILAGNAAI